MDLRIPQGGIEAEECFCWDLASLYDAINAQLKEPCRDESLLQERQDGIQVEECFCCDLSHFDAIATKPKESCREEPLLQACREESLLQERQRDLQQMARVASFVLSTIFFLGNLFNVWRLLSIIQVQPLHKEHGLLYIICLPLLMLLGFIAFVGAIAVLGSVRAPVTRMQKVMVMSLVILTIL